jgi:hypothetical protein
MAVFFVLGCESAPPPPRLFTQTLQGEAEPMLAGTRWEVFRKFPNANSIQYYFFENGGRLIRYDISGNELSGSIGGSSSWQRTGDTLTVNGFDGRYQEIGKISDSDGIKTIVGTGKDGGTANNAWEFTMTQR